jgi:hypothetical protein
MEGLQHLVALLAGKPGAVLVGRGLRPLPEMPLPEMSLPGMKKGGPGAALLFLVQYASKIQHRESARPEECSG